MFVNGLRNGIVVMGGSFNPLAIAHPKLTLAAVDGLELLIGREQDHEWHPEGGACVHVGHALDCIAQHRTGDEDDLIVGLAVLCHDLGKPMTTKFEGERMRILGHEEAGLAPTLSFLRRITNKERILRDVPPLIEKHMQPFSMWKQRAGDAAIRRLEMKVGRIDRLLRVAHADDEGRPPEMEGARPAAKTSSGWRKRRIVCASPTKRRSRS